MQVLQDVLSNTLTALAIFALAALILAFASGGNVDRLILRLVIELPLLLVVAGLGMLVINGVAGGIAVVAAGSRSIAALVAALVAWAIASPPEFAGLGYHWLLRPAYAAAIAFPWLTGMKLQSLIGGSS